MCRAIWLRAALEAPYAANPSSCSRKADADPESLEMKVIVPIGMPALSNRWAKMIGPIVFVCR